MTTLYRPVLIESAEQAEALPADTIALLRPDQPAAYENHAAVKIRPEETSEGVDLWLIGSQGTGGSSRMVGWTALVPIEAEEEWTPMVDGRAYVNGKKSEAHVRATVAEWPGAATGHRLVTPWEETP